MLIKEANEIKSISIIIFCYNESGNISKVIDAAISYLQNLDGELVIINDGSTDNTKEICEKYQQKYSEIKLINHSKNKGIGMSLKSGYNASNKEYVCAIPGDGQFDISELSQVKTFNNNVYYSFYRRTTGYNLYRKSLTWLNRLFNQHLLGIFIRDVNWIKVYRKDQLRSLNVRLSSSLIESEICAKLYKCGVTPIEIPSAYLERKSGLAKGGAIKNLIKLAPETLQLFWDIHFKFSPINFLTFKH
jgi:glycosyltransferase involved in cell wall biosynthesis